MADFLKLVVSNNNLSLTKMNSPALFCSTYKSCVINVK